MAEDAPFYEDEDGEDSGEESVESEEGESGEEGGKKNKKPKKKAYTMDPDHRLLLKNAKPLLQSRNAAVRHCISCIIESDEFPKEISKIHVGM